eukprot:327578-Pyramimonas_sp.AAC.1
MTACIVYRKLLSTFDLSKTYLFVFADGSPQYRGTELFAVSIDVVSGTWRKRMLLPCVTLPKTMMKACGKGLRFKIYVGCATALYPLRQTTVPNE